MPYTCRRVVRLVAGIVLMLAAARTPALAGAQSLATIAGAVHDANGAGLVGAGITLRGATARDVETSEDGRFEFQHLPAGDYEIAVTLSGFQQARRTLRIAAGERVVLALALQLALVDEASVTARKVGERDVHGLPMAINAVSGLELGRQGMTTIDQAAALSPSVTFTQNANHGQLSIRGIGTNAIYTGADPSSVMYLDGVYLARPAMAFVQFLDLDRLEVLRGPQGTLFGRNAVGGAINLVSKPPTNDLQATARVAGGNYAALRAEARASGPLKRDRLLASVSFLRSVQDGYVHDLEHAGRPLGGDDAIAARGQLRLVFDRRTTLLLASDVNNQTGMPLAFNKVLAVKPGFVVDNPPGARDVRTSEQNWQRLRQYGSSARLTAILTPRTSVTSLTAVRALDYRFLLDADMTELDLTTFHNQESQHQLSEEVIVSHQQQRLSVVGGVFVFHERDHQFVWVEQPASMIAVQQLPKVDADSRAVFGEATLAVRSRLSATAGLRYTHEGKDIDNAGGRYVLAEPTVSVPGSVYAYSDAIAHAAWTPKFSVALKLPHEALTYVSAARGFKSGGFNVTSTQTGRGFDPEWVWSYEAGLKGSLFGRRSTFAISGFVMDYTNLQVQNPIQPGVLDIRNAAAATIAGVEFEHTSRLGRGFEAGGHANWLDATYDQYVAVGPGGVTGDVAGNRLNNAPEWAGRLWVSWNGGRGWARRLSISADASAQSTVFYSPFNETNQRQSPYALLGGRVEYGPRSGRWSVAAYARNLTDTAYITAAFANSPAVYGGRPGPPRQFAIEFTIVR